MGGDMPDMTRDNKPNSEAEYYSDRLQKVDEYIKRSLFGQVSEFTRPFSEQHKRDVIYRIPEDIDVYNKADRLQTESRVTYFWLRFFSTILFFIFILSPTLAYILIPDNLLKNPFLHLTLFTLAAFAAAILLAGARLGLRWYAIDHRIEGRIKDLAMIVTARFNEIKEETNRACNKIDSRTENGTGSWPQRARGWTRIALWSTIRGDAIDRYATTVFWKTHVSVSNMELFGRLIKGFGLIAGLSLLFFAYGENRNDNALFYIISPLIMLILWCLFWGLTFIPTDSSRTRYAPSHIIFLIVAYAGFAGAWLCTAPLNNSTGITAKDIEAVIIGFLFVMAFWYGWIVLGEKDDDTWTKSFISQVTVDKQAAPNTAFYFNTLSDRIQNLIEEIIDRERSSRGTPPQGPA